MTVMKTVSYYELIDALACLGVKPSSVILVSSDIGKLGFIKEYPDKTASLSKYLEALREMAGPQSTIVMPTFSLSLARGDAKYVHEESRSETGALTEFFRSQPGVTRSLHPLFSYSALGPQKDFICSDCSRNSFGIHTPLARMVELGGTGVCLGIHPIKASSVHHYAEHLIGVPYRYNKIITTPVFLKGSRVAGDFFAFLRYLHADIEKDSSRFLKLLEDKELIKEAPCGEGRVYAYQIKEFFDSAVELLMTDIYGLLKHPPQVPIID
jgi:aminoglycoside 3-N-acetyltransferase